MFGIRASARRLRARIQNARTDTCAAEQSPTEHAAIVAHALYQRERADRTTTLRQLHQIVELTQIEAMHAIRELETGGMVTIADEIDDALESRVELTPAMHQRMAKILQRAAA